MDRSLEHPLWPAALNGWRGKCPSCGKGPLLRSYLTLREECPVCGEDLSHARADDGPAYLTILVVGHIMAPLLLAFYAAFQPEPLVTASIFAVGTVALSLYLLPRLKGMIVGFQWAKRMHGFAAEGSDPALMPEAGE